MYKLNLKNIPAHSQQDDGRLFFQVRSVNYKMALHFRKSREKLTALRFRQETNPR